MSRFPFLVTILASLTLPGNGSALGQPVRILEHDIPNAVPFFADVDGDGKKDLLVGQFQDDPFTGSRVRMFRNIGTAKKPKFDEGTFLQAAGRDAICNEFCYTGFGPQIVDFNGDGVHDLITGSRDAQLFFFPGTKAGTFDAAIQMTYVPDKRVHSKFLYNSRLFVYDWDSDGDMDLLAARYSAVWLIRNDGNSTTPQFAMPVELVQKGDDKISLTVPVVADWNDDGRDDLILGRSDGSVVWLENTADAGDEPKLASPIFIVEPSVEANITIDANGHFDPPQSPSRNIRLCVADYNDDGKLDLLIGDAWMMSSRNSDNSDEAKARRVTAYAAYRETKNQLEIFQKIPENETEDARVLRETKTATQTAECGKAWRAAYYVDGKPANRHGSVWLVER